MTIGRVDSDQGNSSDNSAWGKAASLSAGAACVLLVSAILLAVWSRLSGKFGLVGDPPPPSGVDVNPWNSTTFVSISAAVTAAVLLIALTRARGPRRSGAPLRWRSVGGWAIVALVFVAGFHTGITVYYRQAMNEGPVSVALPAAVGAWVLVIAGTVAAMLAGLVLPWWTRRNNRMLVLGAVIGVVASTAVAVTAASAGNDDRYIDATTADRVDVPPYPSALGQHRFTLTLPDALSASYGPRYEIWPAGAGFITAQNGNVTAYGADGNERWHYRRTGPGPSAIEARAYDQGATVVLAHHGRSKTVLVGLDAMTGQRLWTRSDEQLDTAFHSESGLYDPDPFLVYRDEQTWTRFDARSGRPMWSVPNPRGDCSEHHPADTTTRLASILWCDRDDNGNKVVDFKVLVADPKNGEKLWENTFLQGLPSTEEYWTSASSYVFPTGAEGFYLQTDWRDRRVPDFFFNADKQLVVPLPPDTAVQTTPAPAQGFLAMHRQNQPDWDVLSGYGNDGQLKCTTTTPVEVASQRLPNRHGSQDIGYVALRDGFVFYDFGRKLATGRHGQSLLRMFSNTTCQPISQVSFDAFEGLVTAPGVVLALRQDATNRDTVLIEGYA